MKKILFIIILLFCINVKAENINLNDIKDNFEYITYVEITDLENIDNIKKLVNLKEIYIKNVNVEDISFINDLTKLEKISIYYSKVDLSKINRTSLKELDIIRSYVVNDDFSRLAYSNLKKLDLEGSYVTSIYTLKNAISLEELSLSSISNLRSLDVITYLPKIKILNINGSEDLVNDTVLDYIKKNNIIGDNYDETKYMYLNGEEITKELDKIITDLKLDKLSDREKIKKITLYVVNNLNYDDDCGINGKCEYNDINFNSLLKSLSGNGICYHYAILTNELLNRVGIKSYLVSGFNKKGLAHEWLNIYLDGKWYGLDPTWIDSYNLNSKLQNTGKCSYFMIELNKDNTFVKDHIEDVLPMNIVDPEKVIFDIILTNTDFNIYEAIFIGIVVIIPIVIIILINKKFPSEN